MKITFRLLIALLMTVSIFTTSCQKQTDYSNQINALQARCDSLAAALKVTNSNLLTLNNTVSGLGTSLTSIQTQLAVIVGQVATLNSQLTAISVTVSNQGASITSMQAQIAVIVGQIATLNSQMTVTNITVTGLGTSITSIQAQLLVILGQITTLNSQQTITDASIATINAKIIASNNQLNILSLQLNALLAQQGILIDVENNVYHTVTIGTQVWMVENLKTTKFRNGDAIPYFTQSYARGYCWYGDNISNKVTYGAIYNYYTAMDSRSVCPIGWHVPTLAEWTMLSNYLGGNSVAGGKLKEAGTVHWTNPNVGANNESGFTALPGGAKDCSSNFISINLKCQFWVSAPAVAGSVNVVSIYQSNNQLTVENIFDCNNVSIRCIKD